MKRFLSVLLIAMLLLFSGCTEVDYDEEDVIYNEIIADPIIYSSAKELENAADCVFEGVVVDMTFLAETSDNRFYVCTTYKILVTDRYKGNAGIVEYVSAASGIRDKMVDAQVQALHKAGDQAPYSITIDRKVPVLEIGETYIFFAGERLNEEPYSGSRPGAARVQFAINDDTDLTWAAGKITQEDVYEHFGVNPVLRTVLRIGFAVVIVAGAAVVTVLIIRRKKRKATLEETEQILEET